MVLKKAEVGPYGLHRIFAEKSDPNIRGMITKWAFFRLVATEISKIFLQPHLEKQEQEHSSII